MTDEERKAKDAARKREAYARRKAALSPKHPTHYEGNPTPEAEEAWKQSPYKGNLESLSKEQLAEYVSSREHARAVQAESTARAEYVQLLFEKYAKTTNIPQLLAGTLRETIETRVVMTDLLAEILNEVRK